MTKVHHLESRDSPRGRFHMRHFHRMQRQDLCQVITRDSPAYSYGLGVFVSVAGMAADLLQAKHKTKHIHKLNTMILCNTFRKALLPPL